MLIPHLPWKSSRLCPNGFVLRVITVTLCIIVSTCIYLFNLAYLPEPSASLPTLMQHDDLTIWKGNRAIHTTDLRSEKSLGSLKFFTVNVEQDRKKKRLHWIACHSYPSQTIWRPNIVGQRGLNSPSKVNVRCDPGRWMDMKVHQIIISPVGWYCVKIKRQINREIKIVRNQRDVPNMWWCI